MKAKKYKIEICIDIAHQWFNTIEEVCVPELYLFINAEATFTTPDNLERMQVGSEFEEIELDDELCRTLASALKTKGEAEEALRKVIGFPDE